MASVEQATPAACEGVAKAEASQAPIAAEPAAAAPQNADKASDASAAAAAPQDTAAAESLAAPAEEQVEFKIAFGKNTVGALRWERSYTLFTTPRFRFTAWLHTAAACGSERHK